MLPAPKPQTANPAATPRISGNHFCSGETGVMYDNPNPAAPITP